MTDPVRVLVTGASGNIGRALIEQCAAEAAELQVIPASRRGESVADDPGRALDLLDAGAARAAMRDIDRLFLLTPADPEMERMTANAVEAARAAGVRHVVRISGAGADPASAVALARWHGRCDQRVINAGMPYTLLRPTSYMQNFTTFLRDAIRAGAVYTSQGEGRVPDLDARDVAAVAVQILRAPAGHAGRADTLTGPEALSMAQELEAIAHKMGNGGAPTSAR